MDGWMDAFVPSIIFPWTMDCSLAPLLHRSFIIHLFVCLLVCWYERLDKAQIFEQKRQKEIQEIQLRLHVCWTVQHKQLNSCWMLMSYVLTLRSTALSSPLHLLSWGIAFNSLYCAPRYQSSSHLQPKQLSMNDSIQFNSIQLNQKTNQQTNN